MLAWLSLLACLCVYITPLSANTQTNRLLFECPSPSSNPTAVPENRRIAIKNSLSGILCTLTKVTGIKEQNLVPVGRSYDGNKWEAVAGPYNALEYKCSSKNSVCVVRVPRYDATAVNQTFVLTAYKRNSLPVRDEAARFFEQTTFGTTTSLLNDVENELLSREDSSLQPILASWIYDQINNVAPSLHRVFFRERAHGYQYDSLAEGISSHPCDVNSRWVRMGFHRPDAQQFIEVAPATEDGTDNQRYSLSLNGNIRTIVENFTLKDTSTQDVFISRINAFKISYVPISFKICVINRMGGKLMLSLDGKYPCTPLLGGIPPISFQNQDYPQPNFLHLPTSNDSQVIKEYDDNNDILSIVLKKKITDIYCKSIPVISDLLHSPRIFGKDDEGRTYMHASREVMFDNDLQNPMHAGGGEVVLKSNGIFKCANVPRTFLNEEYCQVSYSDDSCTSTKIDEQPITLGRNTIKEMGQQTKRSIHYLLGLDISMDTQLTSKPCDVGSRSRWIRKWEDEECETNLHQNTHKIFLKLLRKSDEDNLFLKDVFFPRGKSCHQNDKSKFKMKVKDGNICYMVTHPDNFNVYDFTEWSRIHPGNMEGRPNPIKQFLKDKDPSLRFPWHHPLFRWQNSKQFIPFIGRLGDQVSSIDLPENLRSYLPNYHGDDITGRATIICGSPGEVANDENYLLSTTFSTSKGPGLENHVLDYYVQQKKTVWINIVLGAKDQLRQRMAWALSQILVVSTSNCDINTEVFLNYHDIFVRNAFGNYRDILREVAYSPMMAENLSYIRSKSSSYVFQYNRYILYADENFAREIMQLFSIGFVMLNLDGTPMRDANGKTIRTYTNEDIMSYAKVWTGFDMQSYRGNFEQRNNHGNFLDPMRIRASWRDRTPKMGLNGQYIGDKYLPCTDLPQRAFLRKGATYRLLGQSELPELENALRKDEESSTSKVRILNLHSNSWLRRKLCNMSMSNEKCILKNSVELDMDISCVKTECNVDTLQVVKLYNKVFYEYVRPPCVNFPFFNTGTIITNTYSNLEVCANRNSFVAAEACCNNVSNMAVHKSCKYTGERVSFHRAQERCSLQNRHLCKFKEVKKSQNCCENYRGYYWTNDSCDISVKVDSSGKVFVDDSSDYAKDVSIDFFRVHWEDDKFPSMYNNCGNGLCTKDGNHCLCRISVVNSEVFTSIPTIEEVLQKLHIGAISPHTMANDYTLSDQSTSKVKMYFKGNSINSDTIFEVTDNYGRLFYLRNLQSSVEIQGSGDTYKFRNPPKFFDVYTDVRNSQYETEAALDHYFYHQNVAPFLTSRLIQRFGVSNPSPRFIERVARAFQEGYFAYGNDANKITFGSGGYGDLSSTVAAILLDRESRNTVLDSDLTHGSLREPLLKVVALMRNLNFESKRNEELVTLYGLENSIGQMAYEFPSVFSFFLPEYAPPGVFKQASLVAPEAMAIQYSIGLLNGMFSMVKFGLTSCFGGFGPPHKKCDKLIEGQYGRSAGSLTFEPSSPQNATHTVNEIATLLTSGRLSKESRSLVENAYKREPDRQKAHQLIKQLILTSPEFHVTGGSMDFIEEEKVRSLPKKSSLAKHKAVVHILLAGGCDSFNVLVPHSNCKVSDLYAGYEKERGTAALNKNDLLKIDASSSNQACSTFGLHPRLSLLQSLYEDGDASFLASIGVLTNPVDKTNFERKTVTQLFAHNDMQAEIGSLDPHLSTSVAGTLGRISDALTEQNYVVNSFAVDGALSFIEGSTNNDVKMVAFNSNNGLQQLDPTSSSAQFTNMVNQVIGKRQNIFTSTWASSLQNLRMNSQFFKKAYENAEVKTIFPTTDEGRKMESVLRLIASSADREVERDLFFVQIDGYDQHHEMVNVLDKNLNNLNEALDSFVSGLKEINKFDDVTVVVSSDFGRTLSPNSSNGTDHAWSGHSFMFGGSVKGGKIFGSYPDDLSINNPLNVGRGRFIPTLPWEALWNAVIQWLGLNNASTLDEILPNRKAFDKNSLFEEVELFTNKLE